MLKVLMINDNELIMRLIRYNGYYIGFMDENIKAMHNPHFEKVYKNKIRPLSEKFVVGLSEDIANKTKPNVDTYSFYYFLVGVLHFCKSMLDMDAKEVENNTHFDIEQIKSDHKWVETTLDIIKEHIEV